MCVQTPIDCSGDCPNVAIVTAIQPWHRRRYVLLCRVVCLLAALDAIGAMAQQAPDVIWSRQTDTNFVSPVAISPDGIWVATSGPTNSIRLANLADGAVVRHFLGHTDVVASIAFSPRGGLLASTADDRTLRLWELSTGALLRTISLGGGQRQFSSVAFHPDGEHVATDRSRTNVVVWRISDGMPVWERLGNASEIESLAFSPDGSLLVAAGGFRGADAQIRVFQVSNGNPIQSLTTSNTYGVRELAFSPDGQWLAAGTDRLTNFSGAVELWRVADWTRVRQLPVHAPALGFSPDSKLLVTLRPNAMELWTIPEGTLVRSFGTPVSGDYAPHLSIAVSPAADRIVTVNYRFIATPNGTLTESTATAIRFPMRLSVSLLSDSSAAFSWTGGYPLYQVQRRTFDGPDWVNIGEATTNRSVTLPLDGPGAMFRVVAPAQQP